MIRLRKLDPNIEDYIEPEPSLHEQCMKVRQKGFYRFEPTEDYLLRRRRRRQLETLSERRLEGRR